MEDTDWFTEEPVTDIKAAKVRAGRANTTIVWQDSVGKTDTEMTIPQIVLGHPGNLAEDQEPGKSFPCQLTLE